MNVQRTVHSIVIVGELTRFELFYFRSDLKVAQMNVKHCLIQDLIRYELYLVIMKRK